MSDTDPEQEPKWLIPPAGHPDHQEKTFFPVYDRLTSRFEWYETPPPSPPRKPVTTHSFEIENKDGNIVGFIADGVRVGLSTPKWRGS